MIRWGLLPSWAKDRKLAWKMINARAETVTTAAAFKKAFEKRRCLLPVDGFFEWKKVGKEKRPYMIAMADGEAFTLAGLWENWKDPDSGEWVRTFTIITTDANELVAQLHDRMPVVIAPEDRERWLKGPNPKELLKPYPAERMTMWPVSPKLNFAPTGVLVRPIAPTVDWLRRIADEGDQPGHSRRLYVKQGGPCFTFSIGSRRHCGLSIGLRFESRSARQWLVPAQNLDFAVSSDCFTRGRISRLMRLHARIDRVSEPRNSSNSSGRDCSAKSRDERAA
jgi:hypothetical protein